VNHGQGNILYQSRSGHTQFNLNKNKMLKPVYRISAAALSLLLLNGNAFADFKDGKVAYEKQDYATALRELSAAAKSGNGEAEYLLGTMQEAGLGVPKNQEEAVKLYRSAVAHGSIEANIKLGDAYANGLGVRQDPVIAAYWHWKAAAGFSNSEFSKLIKITASQYKEGSKQATLGEPSKKIGLISDSCDKPKYPEEARRLGHEGEVVLVFLVDSKGETLEVSLAQSSGSTLLDESVLKSFGKCKFRTKIDNGVPRMSAQMLVYRFILD
jgi:TonB family protein